MEQLLPNSVEELKQSVQKMQAEHDRHIQDLQEQLQAERTQRVAERNERIEQAHKVIGYFEEIQLMRRKIFGRSAERLPEADRKQLWLFNEAEALQRAEQSAPPEHEEKVPVRAHLRAKRGRKPLPEDLPRVETIHDIPESEKICGCGTPFIRIGEEVCEKLETIPAQVRVRRHIRPKYACRVCEGSGDEEHPAVRIAPAVPQLIAKSIASPSVVAYMLTAKLCDALPFYRQEQGFARMGVDISRQDMANWTIQVAHRVEPLLALLRQQILGRPVVGIDETPVQVLREDGRVDTSTSYMWVFLGGQPGRPVVDYRYHPTRSGRVPLEALSGYKGFIQTDGYDGYDELGRQPGILHAGCWAHVRRKFYEAYGVTRKPGAAEEAMKRIKGLFTIERALREQDLQPEAFLKHRRRQVEPILEDLNGWLEDLQPKVPPATLLGQAIGYAVEQWPKLIRYLESPYLGPSNNGCERAIRPFVVGRKNWLFSGSPVGASASAGWYSLIETAKANAVEPYLYLRAILSRLPDSREPEAYRSLLPWQIEKLDLLDFDSGPLF